VGEYSFYSFAVACGPRDDFCTCDDEAYCNMGKDNRANTKDYDNKRFCDVVGIFAYCERQATCSYGGGPAVDKGLNVFRVLQCGVNGREHFDGIDKAYDNEHDSEYGGDKT